MQGYFRKKIEKDNRIDMEKSNSRSINKNMKSHFEGYYSDIHDQELPTKHLKNKSGRDDGKQPTCSNKCRLCKTNKEDVGHKISECPNMFSRYYLPLRHDAVAKYLFQAHIAKINPGTTFKAKRGYKFVYKVNYKNTGGHLD